MTHFSHDCPHTGCRTRQAGFTVHDWVNQSGLRLDVFARCGVCKGTIVAVAVPTMRARLEDSSSIIQGMVERFGDNFVVRTVYPEPPRIETVESLPPGVERAFLDGEANFTEGRHGAAAARYRTALERGLKALHPDDKGELNKRIRGLAARNEAPSALIDLMDGVRFIGNDATHDEDDPPAEEVAAGRDFTRLLLTYLFELPARVEAARTARDERRAG